MWPWVRHVDTESPPCRYSCFCTVFDHAESSIASYSHRHMTHWIVLVPFSQTRLQLSQPDHSRYLEFSLIFMWESSVSWRTGSLPWITASSLCLFHELASSDSPSSECRSYQTSTPKELYTVFSSGTLSQPQNHVPVKNKLLLITKHTCFISEFSPAPDMVTACPGLCLHCFGERT